MTDRNELLSLLPPYKRKKILKVESQGVHDIMREMQDAHKLFAADYDKVSEIFWKGDAVSTAREIFKFLKRSVIYSIEPDTHQSVKSPSAILATGRFSNGMNDCKHYSLFTAGILDSLKRKGYPIDWFFRFANYKIFSKEPGHVFVVLLNKGREYWIDAVLPTFNNKKSYINKIDKKVNMALYQISGTIGRRKKNADGTKKVSKLKRAFLKVSGAVSRNAFLLLVKLNVKDMATKLYMKSRTNEAALKNKWENLGGNYNALKSAFTKAAKKRAKKKGRVLPGMNGQVGAIQLAAALAAAVPIIAALAKFLGKGGGEAAEEGGEVIQSLRDNVVQQQEQQQQIMQQQPPAYQQPMQQQPMYYAQAQMPQPDYQQQQQPMYYQPQPQPMYYQPQPQQEPQQYGIQVRPATIEGIGVGGYLVTVSGIGTDNEVMEIKEVEPVKKNKWLFPALLVGGLLLASKKN